MNIRSFRDEKHHPCIEVGGKHYCGDSWCGGQCGHPALTFQYNDPDLGLRTLKAYGSMVACGPVWQPFRVQWVGTTEPYVTEISVAQLCKLMWW